MGRADERFRGLDELPGYVYERHEGAARAPLARAVRQGPRPETTPLYRIVYHHLDAFLDEARETGDGYPSFIEREYRKFLSCRIPLRGFARVFCKSCGDQYLLPFVCSGRICPSCTARRAANEAACLVEDFLPRVPYRQYVITYPWKLRFAMAFNQKFLTQVFKVFVQCLFAWLRKRGRRQGIKDGKPATVLLLQRFGGILNLNVHGHLPTPDGLMVESKVERTLTFAPLDPPSNKELSELLERVVARTHKLWVNTFGEEDDEVLLDIEDLPIAQAISEAMQVPGAKPAQDEDATLSSQDLSVRLDGFTLHAKREIPVEDRAGLEKLIRYGLRPPFSGKRLEITPSGQVRYQLAKPWGARGLSEITLSPTDFLRRVAMLIPPPYQNLIRYYGVFASQSNLRPRLPFPNPAKEVQQELPFDDEDPPALVLPKRKYKIPWAQLMGRVLNINPLLCLSCGALMTVVAFISKKADVEEILDFLNIPSFIVPDKLPERNCQEMEFCYDDDDQSFELEGQFGARAPPN